MPDVFILMEDRLADRWEVTRLLLHPLELRLKAVGVLLFWRFWCAEIFCWPCFSTKVEFRRLPEGEVNDLERLPEKLFFKT